MDIRQGSTSTPCKLLGTRRSVSGISGVREHPTSERAAAKRSRGLDAG